MTTKEQILYALHNLGRCESSQYNSLIRLLCDTNKSNISQYTIDRLREINELVFEEGIVFGDEYPQYIETFIKESITQEYCVQEVIDGWKQPPILIGTLEECQEFCRDHHSRFARDIMPLCECEVDYS